MTDLDRKDIRNTLILITSLLIIAIIGFGISWILGNSLETKTIIEIFVVGPLVIIFSWAYYFNQKKQDKQNPNPSENMVQKIIKTDIKISGTISKAKSIGIFIISPLIIAGGILTLLGIGSNFEMELQYKLIIGIPVILIGIAFFFVAIHLWQLGSIQSKGRMYKQSPASNNP